MYQTQTQADGYLRFVNDNRSKYNLKVLPRSHTDYKLIERSIMNTSSDNWNSDFEEEHFAIVRICRICTKVPKQKPEEIGRNNVLLIHGTPRKNVDGILRHGFKPSAGIIWADFFLLVKVLKNCSPLNIFQIFEFFILIITLLIFY